MIEDYINDIHMAEFISGFIKLLIDENEELKERIDKAIEYIENNSCGDLAITFGKDLIEILKGSDKEWIKNIF